MSIATDLQRIQYSKEDMINTLKARGTSVQDSAKISDLSPLISGMLHIEIPYAEDVSYGWCNITGGDPDWTGATWTYQNPSNNLSDIYKVKSGHKYKAFEGEWAGTRFRVMFTTTDVTKTFMNASGTPIYARNSNVKPFMTWTTTSVPTGYWTAPSDGYLIIQKDNDNHDGVRSFLVDLDYLDNPPTIGSGTITSLTVGGQWDYIQYTDTDVDITGLELIATFSNGGTRNVTGFTTVSPSIWESTAGTQTATFTYTYDGVTVSATKTASVVAPEASPSSYSDFSGDGWPLLYGAGIDYAT